MGCRWRHDSGLCKNNPHRAVHTTLLDAEDAHHTQARTIRERLIAAGWRLFRTSFVLAATRALLVNRPLNVSPFVEGQSRGTWEPGGLQDGRLFAHNGLGNGEEMIRV